MKNNHFLTFPLQRQLMTTTVNWWGIASSMDPKCAVGLKIVVQITKFKKQINFFEAPSFMYVQIVFIVVLHEFYKIFQVHGPWFRLFSKIPFPTIGWNLLEVWKFHYEYKLASVTLGLYCRHVHANIAVCA